MQKIENLGCFFSDQGHNTYKTIRLGRRLWLAENLRLYCAVGSFGYGNSSSDVRVNGYLYARDIIDSVCPQGWILPSIEEYRQLYSAWKSKFHNLSFTEFASGSSIDEIGRLPMSGIGELGQSLYDEANFAEIHKAAYFWTRSLDKAGNRKIFSISKNGSKDFSSEGRELCSVRLVHSFEKEEML